MQITPRRPLLQRGQDTTARKELTAIVMARTRPSPEVRSEPNPKDAHQGLAHAPDQ
ncbi:hypothetical protein ACFU5Z_32550 [Streptomyces sp. NPDC057521]|uniref:hypothetical protein n=1 Tax=Streptomyces sp. NPDC057521 TaxID=3346156 RepID=UPI0036CEA56E